jgi:large subunit ribosomal protein L9
LEVKTVKIILKQDVPNLGQAGEIEEVADGYARNYLIPRGMAAKATPGAMKDFEHRQKVQARKHERMKKHAENLARRLTANPLTFEMMAGESGRLYGSVTTADIAAAIEREIGEEVDKRNITLSEPIREVGEYFASVHLLQDVEPQIKVVVESEE